MEKAAAARRSNNESSTSNNYLYVQTPIKEGLCCEKNCSVIITATAEQKQQSTLTKSEEKEEDNERKHEAEPTSMKKSVDGNNNTLWKLSISGSGNVKRAYNILEKNVSYIERVIAKTNGGGDAGGVGNSNGRKGSTNIATTSSSTVKQEAAAPTTTTTTTSSPITPSSSSSNNQGAKYKYSNDDDNNITSLSYYTKGWIPSEDLSEDENIMDLVLIVTRSSQLKQGSMACIIVSPPTPKQIPIKTETTTTSTTSNTKQTSSSIFDRIVCVATNRSFYKENDSDVHAEIVALGQVAAGESVAGNGGRSTSTSTTKGATAYITMPPCKRCFAALVMAGIRRIVSRKPPCKVVQQAAVQHNIDITVVEDTKQQRDRVQTIINLHHTNNDSNNNKKRKKGQNGEEGEGRRKAKTEMM